MSKPPKQLLPGNPIQVISGAELQNTQDAADDAYYEIVRKNNERIHREIISKKITNTFLFLNILIYILVSAMYSFDVYLVLIDKKPLAIIDTKTVMALIGATTVQLGALMISMGKWLFPNGGK